MNFPICTFEELKHVGTLDISKKVKLNHEGTNGLSVSTEPEAWRRINRGVTSGNTYTLTKASNKFIDYHKLTDKQFQSILDWGVAKGYLEVVGKFEFSYFNDEVNQTLTYSFDTFEEAELEAEDYEVEVNAVKSYKGTHAFAAYVGEMNIDNYSLILVVYCILETSYDGVYWHDELDIFAFSAPRGVIVQTQLDSWLISKDS